MSYDGWFTLDGAEFANAARFSAYAQDHGWWQEDDADEGLATTLEESYNDPETDGAPWFDPDEPSSGDFYGFYPLSVVGLEDSSRQGDPTESTLDGGVPGRLRHATKEVVFSGIIAGSTEEAVEYGMRWLRRTLISAPCSPFDARKQGLGAPVEYLSAAPVVNLDDESPVMVYARLYRTRLHAEVTRGPLVNATKRLTCGDVLWAVTFTMTIGDPMIYGATKRIFTGMFGTMTWAVDPEGTFHAADDYAEVLCGDPTFQPLYDPTCVILLTPPTAPNVPLGCWVQPEVDEVWQRAWVTIPANNFTVWGEMLPVIHLTNSGDGEIRDLRIRIFRDEAGDFDPIADDPCSFVTDIVVSMLPTGTMDIDAQNQDVHHVTSGGNTRRADSLVFSSNMRPIQWPVLDCGMGYVLSVDWRGEDVDFPILDLDLVPRAV